MHPQRVESLSHAQRERLGVVTGAGNLADW